MASISAFNTTETLQQFLSMLEYTKNQLSFDIFHIKIHIEKNLIKEKFVKLLLYKVFELP